MIMEEQHDLDEVITILGNPTRRLILKRISNEPGYSLQIAKDMGLSQQLVASHLGAMEEVGLVDSRLEESTRGPKRKVYTLSKSLLVTIELAPHLFNSRMISFSAEPETSDITEDFSEILDEFDSIAEDGEDQEQIDSLAGLLERIDNMLDRIEEQRAVLLYIRNAVVKRASVLVRKIEKPNARRVLYYILHSHDEDVANISDSLNLREDAVREILKQLKRDSIFPSVSD
jgi:predicted transcriptional regulator